jgi:recombination associated protein RdgC
MTAEELAIALSAQAFRECGSLDTSSVGWAAPRDDDQLVHVVGGQFLLRLETEAKLLPTSVINQVTKERSAELEEQQGFAPGRKQMRDIKEKVTDELLPRAFSVRRSTSVWIDPKHGWLVIDSASPTKADEVLKMLLKSIEKLPVQTFRVARSPIAAMTDWLAADEAPGNFTVDQDTELRATGESKATVKYVRHTIEAEEVRRHITAGKQCTRLAMTWTDKISFVLTEALTLKRIAPLDILRENGAETLNDVERFDSDFLLMAGELNRLLGDLAQALGGEVNEQSDSAQESGKKAA